MIGNMWCKKYDLLTERRGWDFNQRRCASVTYPAKEGAKKERELARRKNGHRLENVGVEAVAKKWRKTSANPY